MQEYDIYIMQVLTEDLRLVVVSRIIRENKNVFDLKMSFQIKNIIHWFLRTARLLLLWKEFIIKNLENKAISYFFNGEQSKVWPNLFVGLEKMFWRCSSFFTVKRILSREKNFSQIYCKKKKQQQQKKPKPRKIY